MFKIANPTKKLKEVLASLGDEYQIKLFDMEQVIYRDLKDYRFEISGLNNNRKAFDASLYVWDANNNTTVERIHGITSLESLQDVLQEKTRVYASSTSN